MAKRNKITDDSGLPYFKFFIQPWLVGNIKFCSHSAQGLFINLCVLYWAKKGDLTISQAEKSWPRKKKFFAELISNGVVKVSNGEVRISFLDDQLTDREVDSSKKAEAANTRWNSTKSDAGALQVHDDLDADAMLKEEKRIEENREEEKRTEPTTEGVVTYEVLGQSNPVTLIAGVPSTQNDKAQFSDYERWITDVINGNDQMFEQMLMKEPFKLNGALAEYAKSYLKLLAEYPKKSPPDQHRFRIALIGHISENVNKNYNGQRNTTKGGSGQTNPEPGKDYKTAGGF